MKTYPLFRVHVPVYDALENIEAVLNSGYINEGVQVTQLTHALKEMMGAPNLSLTNSCTSALVLALRLAGVGPGDDVVSTPMTCVATNAAIASLGANIVWADVDPQHGMLDPNRVAERITPKTKAVMAVAWAGTPPNLFMLRRTCKAMDVKLVLDAAHAFDAHYMGKPVHDWADFTCYSFQAIKHFTTGDGGALVCSSDDDHRRAKALKWFGLDRDRAKDEKGDWKGQQWDADIEEIGYKFNMNNLAAAIGLAQLPSIDHVLGRHRCNAALYDELFRGSETIVPNARPYQAEPSHWTYAMHLVPEQSPLLNRDALLRALNAEGIMAGVVHVPNDGYACFKQYATDLPGTRRFERTQLSLPCGWWLEEDDVRHIARRARELAG